MSSETQIRDNTVNVRHKDVIIIEEGEEAKMAPSEGQEGDNNTENNNSLQWRTEKKGILHCTCSCHEKPKHKTENKVTFCDMPREISSSMADTPTSPSVPATPTTPSITYSEVIIVTDPPPGIWPIKRSPSLESRDNPFQPDGDLSKETEDLLSRAVIIRDKFILNDQGEVVISKSDSLNLSANNSPVKQSEEPGNGVIEESLSPTIANESRSVPDRPKQNGKIEDPSVSPDVMKPEVRSDCGNDDKLKGKKKQQKCCIIM